MTAWFAERALLPDGLASDVRFEISDGRFTVVQRGGSADGAHRLPGLVLPGFANCHSHAFHRALRGRTQGDGTFWTWREQMYAAASVLNPDLYLDLARATYAEMALAGITTVGEFHYLHHAADGRAYSNPNEMAEALRSAARDAGIRLTLLDACYLAGGLGTDGHLALDAVQRRFADRGVDAWAERVDGLIDDDLTRIGTAIHSVRAVPAEAIESIVAATAGRPLHAHVSEQPAENETCLAFYGRTPVELLADGGALGPQTSAVHATHLTPADIAALGASRTTACFCPTTERDLADGIGPAPALAGAGSRLSLGTDQHAVLDMFEECRALETNERLAAGRRGTFTPQDLLAAATRHDSLGWPDAGALAIGARADVVAVRLDSVRTAGADPAQVLFAASAADVDTVLVDGRTVVRNGEHMLGNVAGLLVAAIDAVWDAQG
ncbi:MAG: formimidoylglutamate deiminase [Jatrophihabitans sp.]